MVCFLLLVFFLILQIVVMETSQGVKYLGQFLFFFNGRVLYKQLTSH